jgi:hypothetical protein
LIAAVLVMAGGFVLAGVPGAAPAAKDDRTRTVPAQPRADGGRPKQADKKEAKSAKEIYVIVTARLYEVDDAFYKELARSKWLSKKDLDELERQFLDPKKKQPADDLPFARLGKQKLLLTGKKVSIDPGREDTVLTYHKLTRLPPSPEQLRQGKDGPQMIQEGVSLRAQVHISADRRYVRAKLIEKSVELEGAEKVEVPLGGDVKKVTGSVAFLKEASSSKVVDIPDGGSFLLPLQYRPRAVRHNDRWLVALVTPRIYIEEEERAIREAGGK